MDNKRGNKKLSICICCGVLEKEIRRILADEGIHLEMVVLSSNYHMKPEKLSIKMGEILDSVPEKPVLTVYGDCHPGMNDFVKKGDVLKLKGLNCCELILGTELYKKYRKKGTFFFLPEWTSRWREIFIEQMGFKNKKTAADFFNDMHSHFIYIDTGIIPIPQDELDQLCDFFNISIEILPVSLDELKKNIISTIDGYIYEK